MWRDAIFPPLSFIRHQSLWNKKICIKTTKVKVISMFMVKAGFYAAAQTNMKFCLMLLSEFKRYPGHTILT